MVDAAFAFVRDSAMTGAGLVYPSLGAIKVRQRTGKDGTRRPSTASIPTRKAGGGRGPRPAAAGPVPAQGAAAGKGRGAGRGRRRPAGDAS